MNRDRRVNQRAEFLNQIAEERVIANRMREAIDFCKSELAIGAKTDLALEQEERVNFEKCLTQNYLLKRGMDYFGKRDLIYIDLWGTSDVKSLMTANVHSE